jgi:hypothetical protein
MRKFNNEEWIELTSESYREYVFDNGFVYRIDSPKRMFVSKTGTHFVEDSEGIVHTVQKNVFKVLRFDGSLVFVEPSIK